MRLLESRTFVLLICLTVTPFILIGTFTNVFESYHFDMILRKYFMTLDFYQVPHTNVFIYTQPAILVQRKGFYIIAVGFVQKRRKFKLKCLQKFRNGTVRESGVKFGALQYLQTVLRYKYHAVFVHCLERAVPPVNSSVKAKAVPPVGEPVKTAAAPPTDSPVQVSFINANFPDTERNWLDVIDRRNQRTVKQGIAMCLTTLYNYRSASSLIEWMEIQRLMKVDKIYMYGYRNISKNVEDVVKYYQDIGFLHLQPWSHRWKIYFETFNRKDLKKHRRFHNADVLEYTHSQFAAYNDCLYRFGSFHRYLGYLDLDELIVASNRSKIKTYADLLAGKKRYDVFFFRQVRFCVPEWAHIRNANNLSLGIAENLITGVNLYRTPPLGPNKLTKIIIKPSKIRMMGVHQPRRFWGHGNVFWFKIRAAKKHHYKHKMYNRIPGQDKCPIKDYSMIPFQKSLEVNVKNTIDEITHKSWI